MQKDPMARSTGIVGLLLLVALCCCAPTPTDAYRCKATMDAYFQIMSSHNYPQLKTILNESVVWTIPGSPDQLPFNGVFKGPEQVVKWAEIITSVLHMFYDGEYAQVSTDYQGHISFHDEAITIASDGRYYRAAVAHEWHFDDNCKVTIFNGYYDTMVAVNAFYDGKTFPYPIPATAKPVIGVDSVSNSDARSVIQRYQNGDFSQLADNVTTFLPGNPELFRFAGVFFNRTQLMLALNELDKEFHVRRAGATAEMMVENGAVATFTEYVVQSTATGEQISLPVCEHFLINTNLKIETYALYYDTWPLTTIMS